MQGAVGGGRSGVWDWDVKSVKRKGLVFTFYLKLTKSFNSVCRF